MKDMKFIECSEDHGPRRFAPNIKNRIFTSAIESIRKTAIASGEKEDHARHIARLHESIDISAPRSSRDDKHIAMQEQLPNIMNLENINLPAPICFDLGTVTVPSTKGSFFVNEDAKLLVVEFLRRYFTIYDSTKREDLLNAYHKQANFSLCTVRSQSSQRSNVHQYITESRNLLRIKDPIYRMKLLKKGRLAVVSALNELPSTIHNPQSFILDIFYVSPALMAFSVTGVFKEFANDINYQPLRTFHRTFVVTPQDQGFVVQNEMLHIAAATSEQVKAFEIPAPTPSLSPALLISDNSSSQKQNLVIAFKNATSMNFDFSAKCLEDNDWDFQRSLMVFSELNNLGQIPPEAFSAK